MKLHASYIDRFHRNHSTQFRTNGLKNKILLSSSISNVLKSNFTKNERRKKTQVNDVLKVIELSKLCYLKWWEFSYIIIKEIKEKNCRKKVRISTNNVPIKKNNILILYSCKFFFLFLQSSCFISCEYCSLVRKNPLIWNGFKTFCKLLIKSE